VPADISSATFLMLAAALVPNSDVLLVDVGINPTRTGVIDILQSMGAHIALENPRTFGGEPVADIRVQGRALKGIHVDEALVASAIDEFPAIFIAAACAEGTTLVTGAEELRVKESDRIASMIHGLQALGVTCEAHPDGATIIGQPRLGVSRANVTIDTHGDHRIAMSFAVASLRTDSHLTLLDCENVNTSFPGFAELVQQGGLNLRVQSS
jgi:3-phosphoshikimate 1-carboxyvinyltransferase